MYVTCSSEWLKLLPGVLVFDVPAGQGEIAIQCQLAPETEMKVLIEGKGTATISQASMGWAKLQYNVVEQTHVIVYLQAASPSQAPKRVANGKKDATPGAIIKAITITPQGTTTGMETVEQAKPEGTMKVLHNGNLYILRGEKVFTIHGQEVK